VVAGVSASQVLFDPQLNTGIQIAKRYRNYAELSSDSKQEEIVRDVKIAFYAVLLLERLVDVARQSVELAQAHYDNIKAHYDQGTAAEFDLLRAEVQLANARPQLSRQENGLALSKDNLKLKIGLEPQQPLDIIGNLAVEAAPETDTESDIDNLIASNTMIRALKAQEAMLEKNISIENAAYFPVLSAFANYNYQAQDNSLDIGNYEWVNTFMAGLTLSVPLFNGFQTKHRVAQARIGMDRAVLSRMQIEDGIRLALDQAKLDLKEAKERYDALAQSVGQAHRAVDIADVRFRSGVGTQLEVLDSQTALAQTESEQALAAFDYFAALAEWEKLTASMREN
ncbi:TolC family protein, partial [bacterium]|nr:TolC family protein [bacterium]